MEIISRTCTICKHTKPIEEFKKDKRYDGGHIWQCKPCRNKQNSDRRKKTGKVYKYPQKWAEWYRVNSERLREKSRIWSKNNKDRKAQRDRVYYEKHKDIISKKSAEWRIENKEHLKEYRLRNAEKRRINQNNRRFRITRNGGKISREDVLFIKNKFGNKCLCCGKDGEEIKLTIDHIIPVSCGGENTIDNIQLLCQPCNSRKGKKNTDYRIEEAIL